MTTVCFIYLTAVPNETQKSYKNCICYYLAVQALVQMFTCSLLLGKGASSLMAVWCLCIRSIRMRRRIKRSVATTLEVQSSMRGKKQRPTATCSHFIQSECCITQKLQRRKKNPNNYSLYMHNSLSTVIIAALCRRRTHR